MNTLIPVWAKKVIPFFACVLLTSFNIKAQWLQVGPDINGEAAEELSGYAVSLNQDGSRVAIGAPGNGENGINSGQVRVYQSQLGNWAPIGTDLSGEAEEDQFGHSLCMSPDGNFLAVGAPGNDDNGMNTGHVRVFRLINGIWEQLGHDINGEATNDQSGFSVALSADGNRVTIGAPGNGNNGAQSGHVRIFQLTAGIWEQLGQDIDGEAGDDLSGFSVSLSGDGNWLSIGAPGNDGNGVDAGHVRIYQFTGGGWEQIGADIDGATAGDAFGYSVSFSLDGLRIAIGAHGGNGGGPSNGYAKVYQYPGGTWSQVGPIINGESPGDLFGYSISLSSDGSKLAVGAINNSGNGLQSGHVRIFQFTGTVWNKLGADVNGEASNDQSGKSVSISGDGKRVAIGAIYNNGNGEASGHVRVYKRLCNPADLNGDGVVNSLDFLVFLGSFNASCVGCLPDINLDGYVTTGDFLVLLSAFGTSCN